MVIVYRSNTGFTREYAEMLGRAEKIKVYSVTEAERSLESGTEIFYMGPLMAGHIEGVDQAVKRYQVRGVCGVGLSPSGRQVLETISRANYVPNAPIFYLQGGWAPKKVGWLQRRMVGMATRGLRQSLQQKRERTPQEQRQLDLLLRGGSCVAFRNLTPLLEWLKKQEG
mgnify:CR=1 FL=1